MNLARDLDAGSDPEKPLRAVIEVIKGDRVKVAVDPENGHLALNDFLLSPVPFPFFYGFFPGTAGTDGDPLDLILFSGFEIPRLAVVETRIVGAIDVRYPKKGLERKILGAASEDPTMNRVKDLTDFPSPDLRVLSHFYETFETSDKYDLKVEGFVGRNEAMSTFTEARKRHQKKRAA